MMKNFNQIQPLLKREKYSDYDDLVTTIHIFIYCLYLRCYKTKRKCIEHFIKNEYPINLLTKMNESILHTIFKCRYIKKVVNSFISFVLTSTKFRHLNLRGKYSSLYATYETPLSLAVKTEKGIDIIKTLLDNGSIIGNRGSSAVVTRLNSRYPSLNVFQNYVSLQSLSAVIIKKNTTNKKRKNLALPIIVQKFIRGCN